MISEIQILALWQEYKCDGVKPTNGFSTFPSYCVIKAYDAYTILKCYFVLQDTYYKIYVALRVSSNERIISYYHSEVKDIFMKSVDANES